MFAGHVIVGGNSAYSTPYTYQYLQHMIGSTLLTRQKPQSHHRKVYTYYTLWWAYL